MFQENSEFRPVSLLKWFFLENEEKEDGLMVDLDMGLGSNYTGNKLYKTSHVRKDFEIKEAGFKPTGDVSLIYHDYLAKKQIQEPVQVIKQVIQESKQSIKEEPKPKTETQIKEEEAEVKISKKQKERVQMDPNWTEMQKIEFQIEQLRQKSIKLQKFEEMITHKKKLVEKAVQIKKHDLYELNKLEFERKALIKQEQIRKEALEKEKRRKEIEAKLEAERNRPKPLLPLYYFRHYNADKIDDVNLRQLSRAARLYKVEGSLSYYEKEQWKRLRKLPCRNVLLETQLKTIIDPKYLKLGVTNDVIGGVFVAKRNFQTGNYMQGIYGSTFSNGFINRPFRLQV